jgi:hypothetical protein
MRFVFGIFIFRTLAVTLLKKLLTNPHPPAIIIKVVKTTEFAGVAQW